MRDWVASQIEGGREDLRAPEGQAVVSLASVMDSGALSVIPGFAAGADHDGGVGRVAPWLTLWMRLVQMWWAWSPLC